MKTLLQPITACALIDALRPVFGFDRAMSAAADATFRRRLLDELGRPEPSGVAVTATDRAAAFQALVRACANDGGPSIVPTTDGGTPYVAIGGMEVSAGLIAHESAEVIAQLAGVDVDVVRLWQRLL